ncbi:uncharacterized protein G2W53_016766 [Senna tora]|uniref:Uncharacterized protein n=1 Tax=Senna tora TaxID=362788 RepID=A0A834TPS6_9FABA|nr:uncharacterized protein G2W53_016766 [Senna tora]
MAETLDDALFWLPPQFLDDDDVVVSLEDNTNTPFVLNPNDAAAPKDSLLFPSEFPYGFDSSGVPSDLSSPVESLVGSSETESDEEERMADLTRRMAHSTLEVDSAKEKPKEMFGSGSPQSTLCAFGSGCGCRKSSSEGSPTSACQLSSQKATWELLHAAAGEVEKMKLNKEASHGFNNNRSFLSFHPVSLSASDSDPSDGVLFTPRSLTPQQIQVFQLQILKQQQMAKLRHPSFGFYQQRRSHQIAPIRGRNNDISGPRNACPAWPPIQQAKFQPQPHTQNQQFGSGMRAVFLENPSGKKRECAGTGVFLPRRVDNPESKKKPACSTALVPARVAQALNLNLENMMGGHPQPQDQPRFNVLPSMDNEAAFPKLRRNHALPQQKRSFQPLPQPPVNSELRLPQEWTY